ncbi:hypothetical protein J2X50_001824 [Aminobacter sp. BE322]
MDVWIGCGGRVPPPLTPPHKGEGDEFAIVLAKMIEDWRWTVVS